MARISKEYRRALGHYGDFKSLHEGYAILLEEVDELWDEIKRKKADYELLSMEADQVAAMAVKLSISALKKARDPNPRPE